LPQRRKGRKDFFEFRLSAFLCALRVFDARHPWRAPCRAACGRPILLQAKLCVFAAKIINALYMIGPDAYRTKQ
jgi:hypothetical protein